MSLGEYIPNSSTKLLLHLNGSSADSSGNGNNGTDTAITYSQANGKFGQGAGFNGSSSFINLGQGVSLNPTNAITISHWFKNTTATSGMIVCKGDTNPNLQYYTYQGYPNISLRVKTTSGNLEQYSSNVFNDNNWHSFIATWNNTDGYIRIYADGILNSISSTTLTGTLVSPATPLSIGKDIPDNSYFWNGSIDEMIIENVAWSAEKVRKYYTMSKGRFGII